jgi:hypothetical protein
MPSTPFPTVARPLFEGDSPSAMTEKLTHVHREET